MKYAAIFLIYVYQQVVSPLLHVIFGPGKFCRFEETCSQYAARAIREEGLLKGGRLFVIRILKCQPFYLKSLKYESI